MYGRLLLSLTTLSAALGQTPQPCVPLQFSYDSVVCVCNATYCDSLPDVPTPASGAAAVVTSSRDGARFQLSSATWTTQSRAQNRATPPPLLHIVPSAQRQRVIGFGGAFTDSVGINLGQLPAQARRRLVAAYYGDGGIGYTMARVPIGGSDYSTRPYTYDDGPEDSTLANFSLTRDDTVYKLPYLRLARSLAGGVLRLVASAWSAPAWMKTRAIHFDSREPKDPHSETWVDTFLRRTLGPIGDAIVWVAQYAWQDAGRQNKKLLGGMRLKESHYQTWADYYLRFLEEYAAAGVHVWALTAQNEPAVCILPIFELNCMTWTMQAQATWLRDHLGPTLRRSPFNATKILIVDGQRGLLPVWPDVVLADPETASYVDGIAVHWYWDTIFPAAYLTTTHTRHPDKFLLNTEGGEGVFLWFHNVEIGSWHRAETYAAGIIQDLNHWVCGWIDWNIAIGMKGGPAWTMNFADAPIIVDAERQQFYKQPMFYAMGHFSAFVPPDSVIVEVGGQTRHVRATAALTPDQHLVAILLNRADHVTEVTVSDPVQGHLDLQLPAKSVTTVKWTSEQPQKE